MAISIPLDANRFQMIQGTLDSNGSTVVAIKVNPSNHALKVLDGTSGSSFNVTTNQRDANRKISFWATSSADGVTPIYVATDSNGNLLIQST